MSPSSACDVAWHFELTRVRFLNRASALLVDEDVSAANFMARDGRMRAMIMDEPITPLLYRVNGLFLAPEHQVSTVVVVGGVGEWLDVADAVVLMKDYVAYDGLAKARSVSYQFSYAHIQYAGRGVVHRLPWKKESSTNASKGGQKDMNGGHGNEVMSDNVEDEDTIETLSPLRRRPGANNSFQRAAVHLLGTGSSHLDFYSDDVSDENSVMESDDAHNDDAGAVDMSKCSQLIAGNSSEQLYGCGICALWIIQESQRHPEEDLSDLLDRMEHVLNGGGTTSDGNGLNRLLVSFKQSQATTADKIADSSILPKLFSSHGVFGLWETVGFAYRPRRHEVAMTLTRLRGMKFDRLPKKKAVTEMTRMEEEKQQLEEERKKALAALWANRRKSRNQQG